MSYQWGQTGCDVLSVGTDRVLRLVSGDRQNVMSCQWGQTGCDVLSVGTDGVMSCQWG